ncbi:MAG: TIM barrel protein [Betaproteobacteria bacterium]|nr:TIM barrel protein [Betaproteobacteria bacterium]
MFEDRLALHTWSLDTTPLTGALAACKQAGWNGVELRRIDFVRCQEAGLDNAQVLELVRASGLEVACIGTEYGLMFAEGGERDRLLEMLNLTCRNARALGCELVMIAPGQNSGTLETAVANFRAAGEVVERHGVRLALEFNSQHPVINRLAVGRDLVAATAHPSCGLLLDTYHMERCGDGGGSFAAMAPREIFAFQYSDVPAGAPANERRPTDRLPPGQGCVRWLEVFRLLAEKGYAGYLSYEAPNPLQWARPPVEVAREALQATRSLLRESERAP